MASASQHDKAAHLQHRRQLAKQTKDYTHMLPPDILLLIVDHLLPDNPSIACRLGAVNRSWRDTLLSRPGPWQTLTLGGKGTAEKAKCYVERSRGSLLSLKLLPSFKPDSAAKIGK